MKRSRHGGKKKNQDRLSNLPDCILLHILSFMNTKQVIQTCVLSKRWKDLWKYVPALELHSPQFKTLGLFSKFVTKVLSGRDGSTSLHKLDFIRRGSIKPQILKRLVRYAVSHNVQQLMISGFYGRELLPSIFVYQSLTSLKLSFMGNKILFPKSISLRSLTNLYLRNFEFCAIVDGLSEPFSACKMLQTLVIDYCSVRDVKFFCISNHSVANLTIFDWYKVDLIALSTPNLRSFAFTSLYPQLLVGCNSSYLEEVYIDVYWPHHLDSALKLYFVLPDFADVKSLILSPTTLEVLSLFPVLLNTPYLSFGNLNSLKVQTKREFVPERVKRNPSSPPQIQWSIVDCLIQKSSSAQVTIIDS